MAQGPPDRNGESATPPAGVPLVSSLGGAPVPVPAPPPADARADEPSLVDQILAAPVVPMPPTPRSGPNGTDAGVDPPSSPWAQPPAVPVYRPTDTIQDPAATSPGPTSSGAAPAASPGAAAGAPVGPAAAQPVFFPGQPPAGHPGGHRVPVQPPVQPPPAQHPQAPAPGQAPRPQPPAQPAHPAHRVQQPGPADDPNAYIPTAEEFARRRVVRPSNPVATMGVRGAVRKSTFGLVKPGPGRKEKEHRHLVETIRRNFGGLRQVTVVNPKGGAGKTVAVLLLSMTFGQKRGGYILAWDNNETQGTLGMRAQQDFHSRTVRDLMRDLDHFHGAHGRVGDLSQYVRSQGEGMFDVLASDESATAGEMLTAQSFGDLREVVSRFYKLIFVDTGNNVRAENWQAAIDATDQLVVTMSARNDSAETAARMLDHLEQNGRHRLVRQAVTVVSMPPSRRDLDVPSITRHFAARTRTVMLAPYERLIDSGEPLRYAQLSAPSRLAWLRIGAAVAEGL
jgi:MinD-like ATPase involved in chromosome partitioning or flagellar assembly